MWLHALGLEYKACDPEAALPRVVQCVEVACVEAIAILQRSTALSGTTG